MPSASLGTSRAWSKKGSGWALLLLPFKGLPFGSISSLLLPSTCTQGRRARDTHTGPLVTHQQAHAPALRRETKSENQHVQRCHPPQLGAGETLYTYTALLLIAPKSLFGAKT